MFRKSITLVKSICGIFEDKAIKVVNSKFVLTFFGCTFSFKIIPSMTVFIMMDTKMNPLPVEHLKIEIKPGLVVAEAFVFI